MFTSCEDKKGASDEKKKISHPTQWRIEHKISLICGTSLKIDPIDRQYRKSIAGVRGDVVKTGIKNEGAHPEKSV